MTRRRFPPTQLEAIERLDEWGLSLGVFLKAATLGHWVADGDDPQRKLRKGEYPIATLISKARRKRILEGVGVSPKTWRNLTTRWVQARLAHKCRHGEIVLFPFPRDGLAEKCPVCGASLRECPENRDKSVPKTGTVVSRESGHSVAETAALTSENAESPGRYAVVEGVGVPVPSDSERSQEEIEAAALELTKKTLGAREVAT